MFVVKLDEIDSKCMPDGVLDHTHQDQNTEDLAWHVVYTQPKRELVAALNLDQQGYETYFPKYKAFKKLVTGAAIVFEPMFLRYVFFRPRHAGLSISGARSTRGVSFILSGGEGTPAVLKPDALLVIRECEQLRNHLDLEAISPFQPGRQVRLRDGALKGLEGLVQSVSSKRVTLLLDLLGRPQLIDVAHDQLELS